MHALVVEDSTALQKFYQRVLENNDYSVALAHNGKVAIEALKEDPIPDLIILDMRLPHTNGQAVLEYIAAREHLHSIHVVIATATQEFEKFTGMVPSSEFLLKPMMPNQISEIAQQVARGEKA